METERDRGEEERDREGGGDRKNKWGRGEDLYYSSPESIIFWERLLIKIRIKDLRMSILIMIVIN